MAMLVAVAPIAVRALDRQTVTRIAIVAADAELGERAVSVADSLLNSPPPGATTATWKKPFLVEVADAGSAADDLADGSVGGVMLVSRRADGQVDIVLRTPEGPNSARSTILSVAAFGDRCPRLEPPACRRTPRARRSIPPNLEGRLDQHRESTRGSRSTRARQPAATCSGIVFVILLF